MIVSNLFPSRLFGPFVGSSMDSTQDPGAEGVGCFGDCVVSIFWAIIATRLAAIDAVLSSTLR